MLLLLAASMLGYKHLLNNNGAIINNEINPTIGTSLEMDYTITNCIFHDINSRTGSLAFFKGDYHEHIINLTSNSFVNCYTSYFGASVSIQSVSAGIQINKMCIFNCSARLEGGIMYISTQDGVDSSLVLVTAVDCSSNDKPLYVTNTRTYGNINPKLAFSETNISMCKGLQPKQNGFIYLSRVDVNYQNNNIEGCSSGHSFLAFEFNSVPFIRNSNFINNFDDGQGNYVGYVCTLNSVKYVLVESCVFQNKIKPKYLFYAESGNIQVSNCFCNYLTWDYGKSGNVYVSQRTEKETSPIPLQLFQTEACQLDNIIESSSDDESTEFESFFEADSSNEESSDSTESSFSESEEEYESSPFNEESSIKSNDDSSDAFPIEESELSILESSQEESTSVDESSIISSSESDISSDDEESSHSEEGGHDEESSHSEEGDHDEESSNSEEGDHANTGFINPILKPIIISAAVVVAVLIIVVIIVVLVNKKIKSRSVDHSELRPNSHGFVKAPEEYVSNV